MAKKTNEELLELHLKYLFEHKVNFKTREILINEAISDETFDLVDLALSELESHNRQAITIKLCSGGGEENPALAIVGRIRASKCKIIIEAFGIVASAATLILACGHERRFSKFGQFMWHESTIADLEGRTSNIKAEAERLEKEEDLWATWMAEFSKKPKKFFKEQGRYTDKWWSPEQLLEYGIIDKII